MIDRTKARELAEQFLGQQDLRGFAYRFSGITFDQRWPGEWSVVFDVYSPDDTLIDGPVVLIVDKANGRVQTVSQAV